MAYSFFAKAASASKSTPLPAFSPPSTTTNRSNNSGQNIDIRNFKNNIPPFQPAAMTPPPSMTNTRVKSRKADPAFEPKPYPNSLDTFSSPHPNVTIDPVRTAHVPSLMRITGLLLPVRYPNSFYTATITDPVIASVSRVAVYHDHPTTDVSATTFSTSAKAPSLSSSDKVVGGIRCRLEPLPATTESPKNPTRQAANLYIQTLHLLSPYRGRGIAASLLGSLIYDPTSGLEKSPRPLSAIVRHYNIRTVTAHVHEANEEALLWYAARGFAIQEGVVEGYYRRLKPGGAKIVKLELNWDEEDHHIKPHAAEERDDEGDDDWEKVELDEGTANNAAKFEDCDTVDQDREIYGRKRMKSA
ncbi:hypothetical protein AJ79_05955 [Helicocarpus griseus UAMH5409]|uniref:N-acetyltransferase domain-containing protein n=1 Tax=Helicocarpus griseus UAMH5409 TaxID=1447875 RepID=A0A2B7XIT0_9EURO|nr:hypothetical protein AJ79_05955 [Helicocarpus griseus UAMH5409]